MNFQVIFLISLTGLLVSYYISEYTHITHTDRILSRKYPTKIKKIDSLSVRRIIGTDELQVLDPFLKFTHYYLKKGEGLTDHPHRGYDTITYILKGTLEYDDFRNNTGLLNEGDVQWITTGKGLVHAEIAATDCEVLQFYIGLTSRYKLSELSYQTVKAEDIIQVSNEEGVIAKLIAGETLGRVAYTITRNPSYVIDVKMSNKSVWFTDVPAGWTCLIYVIQGEIFINKDSIKQSEIGVLSQWDTDLEVSSKVGSRFLLAASIPLEEMFVLFGQFYMPNYPQVDKAHKDFKNGLDGFEGSKEWRSKFNSTKRD